MDPLLTTQQVATLLNVTPATVRAMVRRGELPAVRLSARVVRYRPEAVQALLEARAA